MTSNSYNQPVTLVVCKTKDVAIVIESVLLNEGIAVARREDPDDHDEASGAVTLAVPSSQHARAREILAEVQSNSAE